MCGLAKLHYLVKQNRRYTVLSSFQVVAREPLPEMPACEGVAGAGLQVLFEYRRLLFICERHSAGQFSRPIPRGVRGIPAVVGSQAELEVVGDADVSPVTVRYAADQAYVALKPPSPDNVTARLRARLQRTVFAKSGLPINATKAPVGKLTYSHARLPAEALAKTRQGGPIRFYFCNAWVTERNSRTSIGQSGQSSSRMQPSSKPP